MKIIFFKQYIVRLNKDCTKQGTLECIFCINLLIHEGIITLVCYFSHIYCLYHIPEIKLVTKIELDLDVN